MEIIPFNQPYSTKNEIKYIQQALDYGQLSGDGRFTKKCNEFLEERFKVAGALLTHSCTAALEMCALLLDIQPGDEIIMPSFTFVSTANSFVLRGGVPVFVDIDEGSLNIDVNLIENAISERTKAIVVVHYAGVSCDINKVLSLAKKFGLFLIEDNAQGFLSKYRQQFLGTFGVLSCLSFHETKNIISGEGGALLINDPLMRARAEIIREKGTNRTQFIRGQIDKYTWVDLGSSFLPGEITAAFLYAQLESSIDIIEKRKIKWNYYHERLLNLELQDKVKRPSIPEYSEHNAHIYYILLKDEATRNNLMHYLDEHKINAIFHYIPLHSSPAGKRFAKVASKMLVTDYVSKCILRLPLFVNLEFNQIDKIVAIIDTFFRTKNLTTKPVYIPL